MVRHHAAGLAGVIYGIGVFLYAAAAIRLPSGERQLRVERSAHYLNGRFMNLVERPIITPGYSMLGESYKTLFAGSPRREPADGIPSARPASFE
ncbi:hypothetical protein [Hufsiella ginkgonis]|uniref:Uncharacterized protein n=1 Tax=Hufsiella ginkgonis TaxID=2695274 RepID=A0A7K1XXA7_9SPHI|nr:hypothetical protein [Hufsiella ginkgonis]MXV15641.1 hypothetical protein [Hufsiella ginkgonis]